MWIDKRIKDYIALSCKPQHLAYAHIKKNDDRYIMEQYAYVPLTNLELEHQIIFNPTAIGKQLASLVPKQTRSKAEVRISIEGPTIIENIVPADTNIESTYGEQYKKLVLHTARLDNLHTYLCGISRELLFQYQLFAMANDFEISCITTSTVALLCSYNKLTGSNDQPITCVQDIRNFIASQNIKELCSHVPFTDDPLLMAELIGLCIAELTYENN